MATGEKYGRYFGFYVTALDRKGHESDKQEEAATALFSRPTAYDLADHIITLEKLAKGFRLTHDYIGSGEIWSHHIAANAITTHHLVAGSITIDKLAFAPLYSQTGDPMEIIATINASPETGTLTISSHRIHLAADSVIADNVIKARHIDVAELSAISADLGTVTAGKIRVAGGLVQIGENVYDTQDGIYVGQGGTIIVTDSAGHVIFDTNSVFQGVLEGIELAYADDGTPLRGIIDTATSGQGTTPPSWFFPIENKDFTVPSGKQWIVSVWVSLVGTFSPKDITELDHLLIPQASFADDLDNLIGPQLSAGNYTSYDVGVFPYVEYKRGDGTYFWDAYTVFWAVWQISA